MTVIIIDIIAKPEGLIDGANRALSGLVGSSLLIYSQPLFFATLKSSFFLSKLSCLSSMQTLPRYTTPIHSPVYRPVYPDVHLSETDGTFCLVDDPGWWIGRFASVSIHPVRKSQ